MNLALFLKSALEELSKANFANKCLFRRGDIFCCCLALDPSIVPGVERERTAEIERD
jgi:hypothetical protein